MRRILDAQDDAQAYPVPTVQKQVLGQKARALAMSPVRGQYVRFIGGSPEDLYGWFRGPGYVLATGRGVVLVVWQIGGLRLEKTKDLGRE